MKRNKGTNHVRLCCKTRVISLLLCIVMVMGLLPASALATNNDNNSTLAIVEPEDDSIIGSGKCGDNLTWTLDEDGTLTISGTGDMWNYAVNFNDNGMPYSTAPWVEYASSLKRLVLESGITSIGDCAFYYCFNFVNALIIPDSVTSIGFGAFYGYGSSFYGYTGPLSIPDSVIYIGYNAFTSGTFTEFIVGTENPNYASLDGILYSKDFKTLRQCPCEKTGTITIPDSVTTIEAMAFDFCYKLTGDLEIPDSVTGIGLGAFQNCWGFTGTLTISDSVTNIGLGAFYGCSGFDTIVFKGNAPVIESDAMGTFGNVTATVYYPANNPTWTESVRQNYGGNLTWVPMGEEIPPADIASGMCGDNLTWTLDEEGTLTISGTGNMWDNMYSIWQMLQDEYDAPIYELVLKDGITSIGSYAFYQCSDLEGELIIPDSVTEIGYAAFYNCSGFTGELVIPDNVTAIGDYAFSRCSGFTGSLILPDSMTEIGYATFGDCTGFTGELVIPDSVTAIGDYAFYNCSGFTGALIIPQNVTVIGDYAFCYCSGLAGYIAFPNIELMYSSGEYAFAGITADNSAVFLLYTGTPCVFVACMNPSVSTIQLGDEYALSGLAFSPSDLDKVHVSIVRADDQSIGIDYYRKENIRSRNFDLSEIPAFTAGDVLEGLQVTNAQSELHFDSGTYLVKIWVTDINGYSSEATREVTIERDEEELAITQQPADITAELNDTVKFTVKASGSGLKYQWQYRTKSTGTWANTTLTGCKTATLSVTATAARNGYQYRCVITDANGTQLISEAATLTVNTKFEITSQPADVTAELNDSVKFTVKASGSGLKYQWQYRTSANGTWANTTLTGSKTATLSVSATSARNGYQYRCVITDASGNKVTSNAATLTVNAKLAITTQPANVTAELNDSVKFTVKASGSGLKYQWQYRSSANGTWANTTLTGCKTATLSVSATTARNGYQYRCVITDASGNKVTSNAATLTVNAKLAITTQPANVTAELNDTVKFTVKASGSGLKYQWQYRSSANGTWANTTLTGCKTATLSVSATTARNGYQYRCVITDANGNKVTSNAATLTVNAKLAITQQPADVNAELNDAVKFTVKASGSGLKYQWQYRSSASGTWANTTLTGSKTATLSATATTARNGYQYRCVITDANGNTVTSNAAKLTVSAELEITAQPEDVSAKLNDAVKFTVKASGSGLKYQWQYRTSANGTWKTTTLAGNKTATLSATATAARNGYQYRCIITDANGNTVTSNAVTLTLK